MNVYVRYNVVSMCVKMMWCMIETWYLQKRRYPCWDR